MAYLQCPKEDGLCFTEYITETVNETIDQNDVFQETNVPNVHLV